MFIRNAASLLLTVAVATLSSPAAAAAQDAATLLDALRQGIAKEMPAHVRVTASGSGYAPAADSGQRQHFRIESYVQEVDMAAAAASERVVRPDAAETAVNAASTSGRPATTQPPQPGEHVLWSTPLGFLAAAASQPVTLRSETLFGTPYRVLTFSAAGGQEVLGYVNAENVLERTRTAVGDVSLEWVFMSWQDFGGVRFPSLIIRNEDGQLSRVLVVSALDRTGSGAADRSKRAD